MSMYQEAFATNNVAIRIVKVIADSNLIVCNAWMTTHAMFENNSSGILNLPACLCSMCVSNTALLCINVHS
jgi:hypothetical protein